MVNSEVNSECIISNHYSPGACVQTHTEVYNKMRTTIYFILIPIQKETLVLTQSRPCKLKEGKTLVNLLDIEPWGQL